MNKPQSQMFNKKAAKPKYKADQIIEKLALQPGETIADLGSGGGYFTYRFAQAVGSTGMVYAVDTNQEFLNAIQKEATQQNITNIKTILTSSEKPELPDKTFDIIFLRNVTHHLKNRVQYFNILKNALKLDGKLVIIEYDGRGGFFSFQRRTKHYIPTTILLKETAEAGYILQQQFDFLSEQSFTIFTKN